MTIADVCTAETFGNYDTFEEYGERVTARRVRSGRRWTAIERGRRRMEIEKSEGGGPTTLAKRHLRASSSGQSPSITPTRGHPAALVRVLAGEVSRTCPALSRHLARFRGPLRFGPLDRGGCLRHRRGAPDGRLRQASQPFPGEVHRCPGHRPPGRPLRTPGWPALRRPRRSRRSRPRWAL